MKVLTIAESQGSLSHKWIGASLAQAGINIRFILKQSTPTAGFLRGLGIQVDELPMRGRLDVVSLQGIRSVIKEYQPDIIHAYTAKACWLAIMAQYPRKMCKMVFYRGAIRSLSKWNPSDWLLFRTEWVDVFDSISEAVAQNLIENNVPKKRVITNYSGVKQAWYAAQDMPLHLKKTAPYRIGCIANYRPVKGLETLIDALDILQNRGIDFEFLHIGSDKVNRFARYISNAKSKNRIRLVGSLPEAWRVLRTFDCAVIPSNQEALSFAALEALACGTPVVASAVGGLTEVIKTGWNGLLVNPKQPEKLADAIQTILKDNSLKQVFRQNGLYTIEGKFNLDATRNRLIKLYEQLTAC